MTRILRPGDIIKKPRMIVPFTYMGYTESLSSGKNYVIMWTNNAGTPLSAGQTYHDLMMSTTMGKTSLSRYLWFHHVTLTESYPIDVTKAVRL